MKPRVSVIIPTYNRAADLQRALTSVITQTFTDWEVMVVDNHSVDDTPGVVERFHDDRITLHSIDNNGVIAASRNLGIRQARGEFIAFLDSDDWWMPTKLAESIASLDRGADIVHHDAFIVKRRNQKVFWRRTRSRALQSPVFDDLIVGGNALVQSTVVVRKALLDRAGGVSEEVGLVSAEDYECWLRLALLSARFERLPKILAFYWFGGGNMTNPERGLRSMAWLREHYLDEYIRTHGIDVPWWVRYQEGRSLYQRGNFAAARERLPAMISRVPWEIRAKVAYMRLAIPFRGSTRSGFHR